MTEVQGQDKMDFPRFATNPRICFLCFCKISDNIYAPADDSIKILNNCLANLHTAITGKGGPKEIKFTEGNQLPFCKNCFDSAVELTQLCEQFETLKKAVSDISMIFSIAVLHRRSLFVGDGKPKSTNNGLGEEKVIGIDVSELPSQFFTSDPQENNSGQNVEESGNQKMHISTKIGCSTTNDDALDEIKEEPMDEATDFQDETERDFFTNNPTLVDPLYPYVSDVRSLNESKKPIPSQDIVGKSIQSPKLGMKITIIKNSSKKTSTFKIERIPLPLVGPNRIKSENRPQELKFEPIDVNNRSNRDPLWVVDGNNAPLVANNLLPQLPVSQQPRLETLRRRTTVPYENQIMWNKSKKQFRCEHCSKYLCNKTSLENHIISKHTAEKPLNCSYCEKRFVTKSHLNFHEKKHAVKKEPGSK